MGTFGNVHIFSTLIPFDNLWYNSFYFLDILCNEKNKNMEDEEKKKRYFRWKEVVEMSKDGFKERDFKDSVFLLVMLFLEIS